MQPSGPCFVSASGFFSFEPAYRSLQTATMLRAIKGGFDKTSVYDSSRRKWKPSGIQYPYEPKWWRVVLAQFYNPFVNVTVLWGEPKPYTMDELKLTYAKAVDQDDDVLTQFVEAVELKKRISEAKSFEQLVNTYLTAETDHAVPINQGKP